MTKEQKQIKIKQNTKQKQIKNKFNNKETKEKKICISPFLSDFQNKGEMDEDNQMLNYILSQNVT